MPPRLTLLSLVVGLSLSACASQALPPAMPEERLTLGAGWIDETPGFPTADQVPTPPPVVTLPTMSSPPVVVPPLPRPCRSIYPRMENSGGRASSVPSGLMP